MANEDDYARLRRMTGETDSKTYTDTQLEVLLDQVSGDFNIAASRIWGEKCSAYADLVNTSEAGSSRSNSDLFKHAKEQQVYFASLVGTVDSAPVVAGTTTRRIERI